MIEKDREQVLQRGEKDKEGASGASANVAQAHDSEATVEKEKARPASASKKEEAQEKPEKKAPAKEPEEAPAEKGKMSARRQRKKNNLKKFRLEQMMSKAELARRANLSVLTIDRIEKGYGCRMDTKRKILEALGLRLGDRTKVFEEDA